MSSRATVMLKRGQVWFVKEPDEMTDLKIKGDTHVYAKSRPWLVVSSDEFIEFSGSRVMSCVPITSRETAFTDYQVPYSDYRNRAQLILCDQISTKDYKEFALEGSSYMYTLSDSLMNQVSQVLVRQLGLRFDFTEIESMRKIVDEMAKKAIEQSESKNITMRQELVSEIASDLERLFLNKEAKVVEEKSEVRAEVMEVITSSRKNHKWTEEFKWELAKDYQSMTQDEVMKKHGYTKATLGIYITRLRKEGYIK